MGSPRGWYPDPMQRFEQRYYDGASWTEHVASGGSAATDPLVAPAPAAASTAVAGMPPSTAAATEHRPETTREGADDPDAPGVGRTRVWGFVMIGCAAALVVGSLLPWFTSWNGDLSGTGWGPGWVSLAMGLALAAYGLQGVITGRSRVALHGWAVAAISIAFVVCALANAATEAVADATLNSGIAQTGDGLTLSFLASLVAILPLVMLWKADRRRRRAGIVGPPLLG